MKLYRITIHGCDNNTVIVIPLTKAQHAFMHELCCHVDLKAVDQCQPTISVIPEEKKK